MYVSSLLKTGILPASLRIGNIGRVKLYSAAITIQAFHRAPADAKNALMRLEV
jgi:hypothetical protein